MHSPEDCETRSSTAEVCEKAYPDSLGPHIAGKDHWKKLRWKVEVAPKQAEHVCDVWSFGSFRIPLIPLIPSLTWYRSGGIQKET